MEAPRTPTRMMENMSIPGAPKKQPLTCLEILRTPERTTPRATSPPPLIRKRRVTDCYDVPMSKRVRLAFD